VYRSVNYNGLLYPVTEQEITAFRLQSRASGVTWAQPRTAAFVGLGCVLVLVGLTTLVICGVTVLASLSAMIADPNPIAVAGIILPIGAFGGLAVLSVYLVRWTMRGQWETWLKLSRFAADNGMLFSASSPNPQYPGMIFQYGSARQTVNHLRSASDRFLDIGNFQFTTSDGKNTTTHHRGFMALHLDRRLPHMVLDAKANGSLGFATFDRSQVLSLEGDFNSFFTLYCPAQYERDALYVFTPDLMALLIDNAAPFDVEIVDNWMFVYSNGAFPSLEPGLYERLFRIVDTVGAKTLSQSKRYVDERVGSFAPNVVAPPGQRLKRGFPRGAIIALIVLGVVFVLPVIVLFIAGAIAVAANGG